MEHIVQFGINIDDEVIKNSIEKNATKAVVASIKKEYMRNLVGNDNATKFDIQRHIKSEIDSTINQFYEDNKNEIIKIAAEILADKMSRTKAVREATSKVINDLIGGLDGN